MSKSNLFVLGEQASKDPKNKQPKQPNRKQAQPKKSSKPPVARNPPSPPPISAQASVSGEELVTMDAWEKLNYKRWKSKQFVLLIGPPAAAKSTLLTATTIYSDHHFDTVTSPLRNPEGAGYMKVSIQKMQRGEFRLANKSDELFLLEKTFGFPAGETTVNFMETGGEAFLGLEPLGPDEKLLAKQEYCRKALEKFFAKNDSVLILLVCPYNEAKVRDNYFKDILDRIYRINPKLLKNVGLVVTKWDLNKKRRGTNRKPNAKAFIKEEMPSTYRMLISQYVQSYKLFEFSIGKVLVKEGEEVGTLQGKPRFDDTRSIILWIKHCFLLKPRQEKQNIQNKKLKQLERLGEELSSAREQLQQLAAQEKEVEVRASFFQKLWQLIWSIFPVSKYRNHEA